MEGLIKKIEELESNILKLELGLNIAKKKEELKKFDLLISSPDFWNTEEASKTAQTAEALRSEIQDFDLLKNDLQEIKDLGNLSWQEGDDSIKLDLEKKLDQILKTFSQLEFFLLFSEENDRSNAILSIHAGSGGLDAQDFALILERMYLRFFEKKGYQVEILDRVLANETGIKTVTMKISGPYAYGHLKGENGVHRLVRISPFDAEKMRHTSFAGVEVIPEVASESLNLKESDLKIEVFRSSGPGGQGVNTTDSAVRISHLPSGLVATCQSERSQHQNKARALEVLRAKLYQINKEKQKNLEKNIKGDAGQGTWGKQIRSYVFQPYQMVKDHRNGFFINTVNEVTDGDLDDFVKAYLEWLLKNKNK